MAESMQHVAAVAAVERVRAAYQELAAAQGDLLARLVELGGGNKFDAQVISDGLVGNGDPLRMLLGLGWKVARNGFGLGSMNCPALERPGER